MQTSTNTGRQHIHRTPAKHYNTLYTSLPPRPEGTSERKHIHTVFTQRALSSSSPNSLLQALPPPVASEERTLGRDARVHLSRLRCGHHPALPTYMHRIGRADDDLCHLCGQGRLMSRTSSYTALQHSNTATHTTYTHWRISGHVRWTATASLAPPTCSRDLLHTSPHWSGRAP